MRLKGQGFTIIILGVLSLVILSCCVLVTVYVVRTFTPKTSAKWYHYASIVEMLGGCTNEFYKEPQSWMELGFGTDDVLELSHSSIKPIPDAYYAYSLYLQVNSELIESGQELLIPGEGVQPFLIETRAPFIYCSGDLNGRLQILEVAKKTLRARLDVSGTIHGARWKYHGEVKFKFSIRPHSLP